MIYAFSQLVTNTFALTSPSLTPVGVSVSPLVALFNHSCDPDAVIVFPRTSRNPTDEPQMQVIALRDISPHQEACIAIHTECFPPNEQSLIDSDVLHRHDVASFLKAGCITGDL
jgi:hypothetical protein